MHKTEESLRRLKTLRDKSLSTQSSSAEKSLNITDDDKIRTQLYVDVDHWSRSIEKMGVDRSAVDQLEALLALVNQFTLPKDIL